jgi:superfamily II DNA/RNA helicase
MSANKSKLISINSNNTQGNNFVATKGSKTTTKGSKATAKAAANSASKTNSKTKDQVSIISQSTNLDDEFGDTWESPVQNVVVSSLQKEESIANTMSDSFEDDFADSWNDTPVISTICSNQLTTDEKEVVSNTAVVDTAIVDTAVVNTAIVDTAVVNTAIVNTAIVDTVAVNTDAINYNTVFEDDNDLTDDSFNRAKIGQILIDKLTKQGYNLYGISGDMIIENWEDVANSIFVHTIKRKHISTVFSAVMEYGFETPREIQMLSILPLLSCNDFIGQAPAGSGKTCAFGIPVVLRTDPTRRCIQTIILTPTLPLAQQHCEFLRRISVGTGIIIDTWAGGLPYPRDKIPHIVVGTLGRVSELVTKTFFCRKSKCTKMSIDLSNLNTLILDEADELLLNFEQQSKTIIQSCPQSAQTCLFSATMPVWMINKCKEFMKPECPNIIVPEKKVITVRVNQHYSRCRDEEGKINDVADCINKNPLSTILIFCNSCSTISKVSESLVTRGIDHVYVHSKLTIEERIKSFDRFLTENTGKCRILLTTDILARGFDYTEISIVINYNMAPSVETYVHRIGRAGRGGIIGNAVTLITSEQEMATMKYIVRFHGMSIKETKDGTSRVKFKFN